MIDKNKYLAVVEVEATYKSFTEKSGRILIEKVCYTGYQENIRLVFIDCFHINQKEYNSSFPIAQYLILLDKDNKIIQITVESNREGDSCKRGEFHLKDREVLFYYYDISSNNKELIEESVIDMFDNYIPLIEPASFRSLLAPIFPKRGIERLGGLFINLEENGDIGYKRINTELYFDGEDELEIGIGSFFCTKRRILYHYNDKLTMETFYDDEEEICILLYKVLEKPTGGSFTANYEMVDRTEKIDNLPNIIAFKDSVKQIEFTEATTIGAHTYYDSTNNPIAIERWVIDESEESEIYRTHYLSDLKDNNIINIKLKESILPPRNFVEFKVNSKVYPFTNAEGHSIYWFYNNRVYFYYFSRLTENKMSTFTSEGYYIFYPLAGLMDLIVHKKEFPFCNKVNSYAIKFCQNPKKQNDIFKPTVTSQEVYYAGGEFIELIGKKFYAMKLIILDEEYKNILWFDTETNFNLKWIFMDRETENIIYSAILTELNL